MGTEHQPDKAIDKVLAALRDAAPPEGMEARIAQRLAQQPPMRHAVSPRWRDLLAGTTVAGAWSRGAFAGAAVAIVALAAVLAIRHPAQSTPNQQQANGRNHDALHTAVPTATPVGASSSRTPENETRTRPCVTPTVLREQPRLPPAPRNEMLLAETRNDTTAPSHPAPELPLTAQERRLVHLAKTADPSQLASLNSETRAKVEAQEAAEFARFFTPPPPPPPPELPPDVNPQANQPTSPEPAPAVNE